jgi:two-component system nitrate/nitrite sensor histidine kinase NarX
LTEERLLEPPRLVASFAELFQARSILTVPFRFRGEPVGRVILLDREGSPFTEEDLDLLQLLIRQLTPVVENVFTLRQLRLRAIEGERDRIARDLHDGVLQTLASLDMQLDVLRRLTLKDPERLAAELAQLQQIVKTEGVELREFVGDLKPLQIESADLVELLESYIDRFRNETGLVVELLADRMNIDLPEKVCREIFQMIREGLNNVKKHAQATHVVIKMKQDERYLHLVIDDNGKGFSFAGTYASEALDSLRLGPISIKEHTHTLNGQLTIESTPGRPRTILGCRRMAQGEPRSPRRGSCGSTGRW